MILFLVGPEAPSQNASCFLDALRKRGIDTSRMGVLYSYARTIDNEKIGHEFLRRAKNYMRRKLK